MGRNAVDGTFEPYVALHNDHCYRAQVLLITRIAAVGPGAVRRDVVETCGRCTDAGAAFRAADERVRALGGRERQEEECCCLTTT